MSANYLINVRNEMLAEFKERATFWLGKIGECFEESESPFNDEFWQMFLEMLNKSLASTFLAIVMDLRRGNGRNQNSHDSPMQNTIQAGNVVDSSNKRNKGRQNPPHVGEMDGEQQKAPNSDVTNDSFHSGAYGDDDILDSSYDVNLAMKTESQSVDFKATSNENSNNLNDVIVVIDSSDEEGNDQSLGQRSQDNRIEEVAEDVSLNPPNNNANEQNPTIDDDQNNEENDNENRIKEETNAEVKQEPTEEEPIPMRRFMASEVDSNDRSNVNDNCETSNDLQSLVESRSSKKKAKLAKPFKCQHCEYATNQKSHLNVHLRTHTGEKPYGCGRCPKRFTTSQNLRNHMMTHKGDSEFHCTRCFQGFSQKNEQELHEKNCRYILYECHICSAFTTPQKTHLEIHMRKHTGEKPHRCDQCSKSYTILKHLKQHTATHKNKKLPFYCIACLRRFAKENQKRAHEKECRRARYECDICKSFVTIDKTKLEIHMRVHTGERPFRCEVCLKYFAVKYNLKKHLNTMHNRSK